MFKKLKRALALGLLGTVTSFGSVLFLGYHAEKYLQQEEQINAAYAEYERQQNALPAVPKEIAPVVELLAVVLAHVVKD